MSHLLKKNKKIIKVIKFIFFLPIFYIFLNSLIIYSGNKLIYFFFSLISFCLIYFSVRKKSFFYETFFSFFIFMGFWFKFSFILCFNTGFTEGLAGDMIISANNYDDALITSTVGILSFILFGYLREIFIFYPQNITFTNNTKFYKKNRNILITSFFFLILMVTLSNHFFQIYQRGLIGNNQNFLINGIVKTSLLYFLTLCTTFFLYFDFAAYKKVYFIVLALIIIETFLSSVSMLSRGMIFNCIAVFYALYKFTNKIKLKLTISFYLKFLFVIFLTFSISVISVNYLRIFEHKIGYIQENEETYKISSDKLVKEKEKVKIKRELNENLRLYSEIAVRGFRSLIIHRWVGIDSMLLITKNKEILNLNVFTESLKEKYSANSPSFYELTFNIYQPDRYKDTKNIKGNTLPGLITYLFFSGSYSILIISMMLCCTIATLLEYLMYKFTKNNLLASSIIGMTIAYRFAHFGYLPAQSYLLFGSILGIIFLLYLFKFFNLFIKI